MPPNGDDAVNGDIAIPNRRFVRGRNGGIVVLVLVLSAAVLVLVLEYDTIATTQLSSFPKWQFHYDRRTAHSSQNSFQFGTGSCGVSLLRSWSTSKITTMITITSTITSTILKSSSFQNSQIRRRVAFRCGATEPENLL